MQLFDCSLFHCVVARFHCCVMILLCCGFFSIVLRLVFVCCATFIALWLASIVLCKFRCVVQGAKFSGSGWVRDITLRERDLKNSPAQTST